MKTSIMALATLALLSFGAVSARAAERGPPDLLDLCFRTPIVQLTRPQLEQCRSIDHALEVINKGIEEAEPPPPGTVTVMRGHRVTIVPPR